MFGEEARASRVLHSHCYSVEGPLGGAGSRKGDAAGASERSDTEDLDNRVTGVAMRMRKKVKVRLVRKGTESFPPSG